MKKCKLSSNDMIFLESSKNQNNWACLLPSTLLPTDILVACSHCLPMNNYQRIFFYFSSNSLYHSCHLTFISPSTTFHSSHSQYSPEQDLEAHNSTSLNRNQERGKDDTFLGIPISWPNIHRHETPPTLVKIPSFPNIICHYLGSIQSSSLLQTQCFINPLTMI